MSKVIRVHELANELGLSNQETLDLCSRLGIGVKTQSSTIIEQQADRLRRRVRLDAVNSSANASEVEAGVDSCATSRVGGRGKFADRPVSGRSVMAEDLGGVADTGPGEIYFIKERDVITDVLSSYVKIGLVRAADERVSEDRLRDIQTGNPRILYVHDIVKTHCVSTVERMMHRKFATKMVLGEWFKLSDSKLEIVISTCRTFAEGTEGHERRLAKVTLLEKFESKPDLLDATEDALSWAKELSESSAIVDACMEIGKSLSAITATARDQGEEIRGIARVQLYKGSEKFDQDGFGIEFPDLLTQFKVSKESITENFTLSNTKSYDVTIEVIHPELFGLQKRFEEISAKVASEQEGMKELHKIYLNVLWIMTESNWNKEVAQTHLKLICGEAAGIDGVCMWNRVRKITISIDKKSLKSTYPSEYAKYASVATAKEMLVLKKGSGASVGNDQESD